MNDPDILVLVVGVFITFMAVWATVVYGVLVLKRRRRQLAALEEAFFESEPETSNA